MKYFFTLFLLCLFLINTNILWGADFVFTKTLSLGMTDPSVKELQKFLNKTTETEVSSYGAGSSGNETDYFGSLTAKALIKFQNLYASEVLAPVGLSKGTGFFGPMTMNKINQLSSNYPSPISLNNTPQKTLNTPKTIISSDFSVNIGQTKNLTITDSVVPIYASSYEVFQGQSVSISGTGFSSKGNIVYFGENYSLKNISSSNSNTLSFDVPKELPLGYYDLRIGTSDNKISKHKAFFVVVDKNSKRPSITSISPTSGKYGTTITVIGENFTKTGNQIRTNYSVVRDLSSSDGKTISFSILPFSDTSSDNTENITFQISSITNDIQNENRNITWPISLRLINDGGVSNKNFVFNLTF